MAKFSTIILGDVVTSRGNRKWRRFFKLPAIGKPLEEYSWKEISDISGYGLGEKYFAIGDTKSVHIKGTVGTLEIDETLYVYIIGFNHNSEIEGNGITFGTFKTADGVDVALVDSNYPESDNYPNTCSDGTKWFNANHWGNSNYGGWAGCDLRYDILGSTDIAPSGYGAKATLDRVGYDPSPTCTTNPVANTLMSALPVELREVMKPMTKYTHNIGDSKNTEEKVTVTIDYLPLLAEFEISGMRKSANIYEQNKQKQYDYYVSELPTHISPLYQKHHHSNIDRGATWWGRSVAAGTTSSICNIHGMGTLNYYSANACYGIAPIFKV